MIAELQQREYLMLQTENLLLYDEGLKGITPASIARTKQRIARGDTQYGNVPENAL